jgi:hypothetical protein
MLIRCSPGDFVRAGRGSRPIAVSVLSARWSGSGRTVGAVVTDQVNGLWPGREISLSIVVITPACGER